MLTDIRLLSHQLAKPRFRSPKELVAWMGAVQAQEYTMAKWAVGTRLKSSSLRVVDDALAKGEILRTQYITTDLAFHRSRGYPLDVAIVGRSYTDSLRFLCKKSEDGDNRKLLYERL